MPAPAHTPATRRFLPASSSSRSHVNAPSSAYRVPVPASSYSSSSLFVKTPYPKQRQRDEIEVSLEDENDGYSPLPDRMSSDRRVVPLHDDTIEDSLDGGFSSAVKDTTLGDGEFEDLSEAQASGRCYPADQFSSPLPKRQKRRHQTHYAEDYNRIPSASIDEYIETPSRKENVDDARDNDAVSSADEGHTKRTRFQPLTQANFHSSQTPVRTAFRSLFRNNSAGEHLHVNSPLPGIFSPSRRKGKRDYMHGGAAETARSWILEIANEQSRDEPAVEKKVPLTSASKDESGRFEIAKDEHQGSWMMVYQDGRPPSHVIQEKVVNIRGARTSWNVELNGEAQLNVAVSWDRV